jgi:hypothetical protein
MNMAQKYSESSPDMKRVLAELLDSAGESRAPVEFFENLGFLLNGTTVTPWINRCFAEIADNWQCPDVPKLIRGIVAMDWLTEDTGPLRPEFERWLGFWRSCNDMAPGVHELVRFCAKRNAEFRGAFVAAFPRIFMLCTSHFGIKRHLATTAVGVLIGEQDADGLRRILAEIDSVYIPHARSQKTRESLRMLFEELAAAVTVTEVPVWLQDFVLQLLEEPRMDSHVERFCCAVLANTSAEFVGDLFSAIAGEPIARNVAMFVDVRKDLAKPFRRKLGRSEEELREILQGAEDVDKILDVLFPRAVTRRFVEGDDDTED